jgi:hypothetical protein
LGEQFVGERDHHLRHTISIPGVTGSVMGDVSSQ